METKCKHEWRYNKNPDNVEYEYCPKCRSLKQVGTDFSEPTLRDWEELTDPSSLIIITMICKICSKEIKDDGVHVSHIPSICWKCYEPTMGNESSIGGLVP